MIYSKLLSYFVWLVLSMVKSVQPAGRTMTLLTVVCLGTSRNTWTLQVVGTRRLAK